MTEITPRPAGSADAEAVYVEHLVPDGGDWCSWSRRPVQLSHPDRKRCPAGCLDDTPRELIDG
jgi:hypothetical protein